MGTELHGTKGYLTVSGGTLLHVTGWEATEVVQPYETTELAATQPTHKSFGFDAPKEIDGTIEVQTDDTEVALSAGLELDATLFNATARTWAGSLGIVSAGRRVNREDAQTIRYDFKGTGDWVKA